MTKSLIAALIASVAAASVFAADAPATQTAKADTTVKTVITPKTEQKAGLKKVAASEKDVAKKEIKPAAAASSTASSTTSSTAAKPAPATPASAPAAAASAPAVKK